MARTIISKQQDHWLSSLLQDPEAEKWPPAFLSFPNLEYTAEASGKSGI